MVAQRKRHLFFGLGLTVALVMAVGLLPAIASAASTLTGESLNGSSPSGNSPLCFTPTYSVSGTAAGPYTGMFSESGSFSLASDTFSATFTITSGTTTVSGSKTAGSPSFLSCGPNFGGHITVTGAPYTATIATPNGNFHDEGTSAVKVDITGSAATLTESFTSSLTAPVLIAPTTKGQCKHGGWKAFPQFKNQGRCVSFVVHQRHTPPAPIAPTTKDQCKHGGWKAFPQFKNQGECVSFVEHQQHGARSSS